MKKYLLFLTFGALLGFTSCEDPAPKPVTPIHNDPNTPPADTVPKINYVTAKSWRITAFTQGSPGSSNQSDIFKTGIPNCQKDDVYRFALPGVLTVEPGNNKCSSTDADQTGTWDLNNNSSVFTLNNPAQTIIGLNGQFTVIAISASKIIVGQVVNSNQYILTFSAI